MANRDPTMLENVWAELGWMWERCRHRFRSALALSLAFKALNLILLAPLAALILRFCLLRWGRASVGNFELVSFFASPVGLVALLGVGHGPAGIALSRTRRPVALAGRRSLALVAGIQKFDAGCFIAWSTWGCGSLPCILALAVPFLAGIGRRLLAVVERKGPERAHHPETAGVLVGRRCSPEPSRPSYCLLALHVFLRRLYAVPILTFEPGTTVSAALRSSIERSSGTFWRCARHDRRLGCYSEPAGRSRIWPRAIWCCSSIVNWSASSLAVAALLAGTVLVIQALVGNDPQRCRQRDLRRRRAVALPARGACRSAP